MKKQETNGKYVLVRAAESTHTIEDPTLSTQEECDEAIARIKMLLEAGCTEEEARAAMKSLRKREVN